MVQLAARAERALSRIRSEHPAGTVLIVGHNVFNPMLLKALLNLSMADARAVQQANDELYVVELSTGTPPRLWKLIRAGNLGDL